MIISRLPAPVAYVRIPFIPALPPKPPLFGRSETALAEP